MIGRFVKLQHIVNAGDDVKTINFSDRIYQIEDEKIYLGFTRNRLRKMVTCPHMELTSF